MPVWKNFMWYETLTATLIALITLEELISYNFTVLFIIVVYKIIEKSFFIFVSQVPNFREVRNTIEFILNKKWNVFSKRSM